MKNIEKDLSKFRGLINDFPTVISPVKKYFQDLADMIKILHEGDSGYVNYMHNIAESYLQLESILVDLGKKYNELYVSTASFPSYFDEAKVLIIILKYRNCSNTRIIAKKH